MWAILPIPEWRCQDIDQVLLHEIIFFSQCIQQQWSVSQNYFMIRNKLPTAACWFWEKKERKLWSQLALCRKRLRHHRQIIQCSSPVEALNLIVESKSEPVELDNSTIGLHLPSRRKNSLQSYCSMDFNFLRYDLWCHVAWRLKFRWTHKFV